MAKAPRPASTQQHLKLAQIRDSVVVMRDGSLRAVLVVSSINFSLKSQPEQDSIIYQFQNFINGLTLPIQILVQSRQLDLNGYLKQLADLAQNQTNELLRFQMVDYIDFVSRLITLANIMDKRFFVVLTYQPSVVSTGGIFGSLLGGRKTTPHFSHQQFETYKQAMTEQANVVISGLAGMGLRAVQLNTQELVELYYTVYNPEEATEEKLVDIEQLRSSVIRHASGEPQGDPNA